MQWEATRHRNHFHHHKPLFLLAFCPSSSSFFPSLYPSFSFFLSLASPLPSFSPSSPPLSSFKMFFLPPSLQGKSLFTPASAAFNGDHSPTNSNASCSTFSKTQRYKSFNSNNFEGGVSGGKATYVTFQRRQRAWCT